MTDYSNLIVVGFKGGFGGDLFSSLLDANYNKSTTIQTDNNNWHSYPAHLADLKGLHYLFRSLNMHLSPDISNSEGKFLKFYTDIYTNRCFSMVVDEDPQSIIDNIIYYGKMLYQNLKQPPKVWCTHYCSRPPQAFDNFTMERMFPGSTKLRLWCEPKYHDLFAALVFFKLDEWPVNQNTIEYVGKADNARVVYENHLTDPKRFDYLESPLEDFVDIDVGKLFFEGDENVSIIENQLSGILERKIDLNKSYICNTYKVKNDQILQNMFGPNYLQNSIETNFSLFKRHIRAKELKFKQQL